MALWSVLLVIGICFSCENEDSVSKRLGQFSLRLSADTTAIMKDMSSGLTKSVASELEDFANIADYTVLVMKEKDTVVHYKRFDQMPASISLAEGAYQLIAKKGDDLPAEFLNPYFEGSTSFTIKEQMNTPLELTCTLANARVTVDYTNDFLEAYDEYTALLSTPFTTADVELPKGETRAVYLQVASGGSRMAVGIKLKKKTETTAKTYWVQTPINLARRQNVHLIFKTDGEALEGIGLQVELDNTLEEVPLDNVLIPPFMWEKFDQPTLTYPIEFNEENNYQVNVPANYKDDPLIGFCMPAGVGHLYIKYWLDGNDEDYFLTDLATDEGVAAAIGRRFSWGAGTEESNQNIAGLRETGSIHLNNALRSLESPETEEQYLYHFEVYGEDATGKATPTNMLSFQVTIPKAGNPSITSDLPLDLSIVENENNKEGEIVLFAEGHIDPEETLLTLTKESVEVFKYKFLKESDQEKMKNEYGITVESPNAVVAIVKYPETVFAGLDAGEYCLTVMLQDQKGKTYQSKTDVSILTPDFTFLTDDGAAFAYYVMLRTQLNIGNPNKLSFQYKKKDDDFWIDYKPALSEESEHVFAAKLASLDENTPYDIKVIYNNKYSKEVTVKTEVADDNIPNAGFEEWSIEPDALKHTDEGSKEDINGLAGLFKEIPYPHRCWEVWQPWESEVSKGWNTLNKYTTSAGGLHSGLSSEPSRKWTRYVANSGTIKTDGKSGLGALVRTVGWGKGNSATIDGGLGHVTTVTPGELYLGNYDNGAHYGRPFTSRPSGFKFDYKYVRKASDEFIAEIVVLNEAGIVIAKSEFTDGATDTWKTGTVKLKYEGLMKQEKAHSFYIRFVSGTSTSTDDLMVYPPASNLSFGEYVGSQLYIDNVELIYDKE